MDFSVDKVRHRSEEGYSKSSIDLAYLFAKDCHKEFKDLIKAIVLFGSTARKKQGANDIDLLVVIDDVNVKLTPTLIQTYRVILGKIVGGVSNRLHVTTLKFSQFWEYVRVGDPIAINILRDGFPLFDTGFFDPLQTLLHQGRIRPSPESVQAYWQRAENSFYNANANLLQGVIDLYWAVIDSSHAALMSLGVVPPSPEHVSEMIEDKLVKTKIVSSDMTNIMRKFYQFSKDVERRKKTSISGHEFDSLVREAEHFINSMRSVIYSKNNNNNEKSN